MVRCLVYITHECSTTHGNALRTTHLGFIKGDIHGVHGYVHINTRYEITSTNYRNI